MKACSLNIFPPLAGFFHTKVSGSSLFTTIPEGSLTGGLHNTLLATFLSSGNLMLILYLVLGVSLAALLVLLWQYSLNRAITRKMDHYRQKVLDEIKLKAETAAKTSEDVSVFTPETIKLLKNRHSFTNEQKTGKGQTDPDINKLIIQGDRYRDFAHILPDLVFECNLDGELLFVNKAAREITGITEISSREKKTTIFDFIHAADIPQARQNLQLIAESKPSRGTEYRVITAGKSIIHVVAYIVPVYTDSKVTGIRGLLVDVSQQKKNEETISTLRDIVSNVNLGINVYRLENEFDPGTFRLEMVNDASAGLLRFSVRENIGKYIDEVSPLLRQRRLHEYFLEAIKSGEPSNVEEFRYQPDPLLPPKVLHMRIYPLPHNRVVLIIEDTTIRKKDEQNARMAQLGIENAGDIILWIDENGGFTFANGTACRKYGYNNTELLGMSVIDIDARITTMQWFEIVQILESKPALTMESINRKSDGTTFPVEMSINRFIFDGRKNYLFLIRDISDRKLNDELEQKIQIARKSAAIKQQFLANMSHEIRTPMTGIMGMTSLLMRTNLSPAQREYVRNIKISSENLLNIINDVLDLSKIEAGKMELKPNKIQFREFISDIREIFQHQAQSKGIRFSTSIEPLIPSHIIVDDQRLKQVINNLLSNAFKFTDDGEISLKFRLENKADAKVMIVCHVKDTGMGISKENQRQIFEKFTQIDTSLIRPFEGTGLGLAICRELTQLMGGEITVESEMGKGSTFTFTFKAEYDQQQLEKSDSMQHKEFMNLKLNVLHVEDKLLNQKVVGFILFNSGCNVDFVKNGQEALDLYQPGKYDVILMDIQMPVMDGITACKELKKLYGNRLCPVIGLSANALEGDAQKYMALGLDDYIVKPFQPQVLYEKLLKWSKKHDSSPLV